MIGMTARQAQIASFIGQFTQQHGFAPTLREISQGFSFKTPTGVTCHLRALKRKGFVTWDEGKSRTIRLTNRR